MAGELNPTQISGKAPVAYGGGDWNFSTVAGGLVNTTLATAKAAQGTSVLIGVTQFDFFNSSAVASEFLIKSGANVIYRGYAPASMTVIGTRTFPTSGPLLANANEALTVEMVTTATATRFNFLGKLYKPAA